MQEMVNEVLQKTFARCWGLQLMVIELPAGFDESIVTTQIQNQNISTMEYEQEATQIRASTAVIQAEFERKVKVIKTKGRANYTVETKKAKAQAKSNTLLVESEILKQVRKDLKLHEDDLLEYQQYGAMSMLSNASLFFGFEENAGVLLQQSAAGKVG